jgi:MoxR-like ATPase
MKQLKELSVDRLRKIARKESRAIDYLIDIYQSVNRANKEGLIFAIKSFCSEEYIHKHIKDTEPVEDLFERTNPPTETKQLTNPKQTQSMEGNQMKIDLGLDLGAVISSAVQNLLEGQREELINKQINAKVEKEVAKLKPTLVRIPNRKEVVLEESLHKAFEDVLYFCEMERQVFVAGPSGSGKTHMASQVAKALGLQFKHISCSAGLSEAHLLGRMLFDGTYVKSDFVDCYENGGIFLFDEIDAADANTLLVVNSALANGSMSVPNRKDNPSARRHKDFMCICAGNTWGSGSIEYAGRNYMDAAFMDRFAASKVVVDYDSKLEKDICTDDFLYTALNNLRKAVLDKKIRRVISTRVFISGQRQVSSGKSIKDFINNLMIDWSTEEKSKIKMNEIINAI